MKPDDVSSISHSAKKAILSVDEKNDKIIKKAVANDAKKHVSK